MSKNDITQTGVKTPDRSHISNKKKIIEGDVVLLSKEDWNSIQETIYLQSVPGLVESIRQAEIEEEWISEEEFMQALDGTKSRRMEN